MVIKCIDNGYLGINVNVEIAGQYTIMPFIFRHFKILQLEKLALFNLAYFCHPPIKPKFPSRQITRYTVIFISCIESEVHILL